MFPVIFPVLLLGLLYIAVKIYALRRMTYCRYFDVEGEFEGQEVKLVEEVSNNTIFPLFNVQVQSYINNKLHMLGMQYSDYSEHQMFISRFTIMPFTTIRRKHSAVCIKRGKCSFETAEVVYLKKVYTFNHPASIYIYPRQLSLELKNQIQIYQQALSSTIFPLLTDPFEFSGVREYQYGDSFNRINFKVTARKGGKLYVNQSDYVTGHRQMVFLNFEINTEYKTEEYQNFMETGLSYCSYLLESAVNNNYEIGFRANCRLLNGEMFLSYPMQRISNIDVYREVLKGMSSAYLRRGYSFGAMLTMAINENITNTEIVIFTVVLDDNSKKVISRLELMGNHVTIIWLSEV